MSHPFPFNRRRKRSTKPAIKRTETPWARAWRISPERMREHINHMNQAKVKKSEETAELVQAILNMLPDEPVQPYKLRDLFQETWNESYGEEKTKKEAWNLLRIAMRHGKIGKMENGLIYPRKS